MYVPEDTTRNIIGHFFMRVQVRTGDHISEYIPQRSSKYPHSPVTQHLIKPSEIMLASPGRQYTCMAFLLTH